jgi:proline iminopeptidase
MSKINIGDIDLFYVIYDQKKVVDKFDKDKPIMIFLHGGPGMVDHTIYVPFWMQLSERLPVIFVDQRGNGQSDYGDPKLWNLQQCGRDVKQFCDALRIERPIIAGVSWGGYVAMSYAIQFPEHPRALIFCNTEAKVSPEARKAVFTRLGGEEAGQAVFEYDTQPSKVGVHDAFIKYCLPHYAKYNPYTKDQMERCIRNMHMRKKFMEEENLQFDFRSGLHHLICPVLLMAGNDDGAHPVESAIETAKSIPAHLSHLHIIDDAGAPVYNDQPEQSLEILTDFLGNIR